MLISDMDKPTLNFADPEYGISNENFVSSDSESDVELGSEKNEPFGIDTNTTENTTHDHGDLEQSV